MLNQPVYLITFLAVDPSRVPQTAINSIKLLLLEVIQEVNHIFHRVPAIVRILSLGYFYLAIE